MDGLRYRFNGIGEYTLISTEQCSFEIQVRLEPLQTCGLEMPICTTVSAIAAKSASSDLVEVQLSSVKGLNILLNGKRLVMSSQLQKRNVSISYTKNDTVELNFKYGGVVKVQRISNYLVVQVSSLLPFVRNHTQGLLGVWNGDPIDDLMTRKDYVLPPDSSMEEIYQLFGEKCKLK